MNGTYWGPMMYGGWWFMPLFGIIFMVICIYMFSRFSGPAGNMCGRNDHSEEMHDIFAELRREIHELRMEIKDIRNQNGTDD